MAEGTWWGRYVISYDDVDLEQFQIAADNSNQTLLDIVSRDAKKRAEKASKQLQFEGVHFNGSRSAEAIFVTHSLLKNYPAGKSFNGPAAKP